MPTTPPPEGYSEHLPRFLAQLSEITADAGVRLILLYHPSITLDQKGELVFSSSQDEEDAFAALCKDNGIYFLNMRQRFLAEYEQNHILPYGFVTSSVGTGHLNKDGHKMVADELLTLMQEVAP